MDKLNQVWLGRAQLDGGPEPGVGQLPLQGTRSAVRAAAHRALRLITGAAAAAMIVACGVDPERLDPSDRQVAFWHQCTDRREEALLDLIDGFNRANPHGIHVSGHYRGSYGQIYSAMGAAIPHEGVAVHNIYGGSIAVCRSTPEQQLASWLFLKWLTNPAQQGRWAQASGYFPVRRSAAPQLVERYRSAFGLLSAGRSEPAVAGYELTRQLIETAMVAVVDGADAEEALRKLEEEANRTLEK